MTSADYRRAAATNVADAMNSAPAASADELRKKALANAMDRIASPGSGRQGREQWPEAHNEYVNAVMPRGHGLWRQQRARMTGSLARSAINPRRLTPVR